MTKVFAILGVFAATLVAGGAQGCELVMGYSDGQEAHLIGPPGTDEGGYKDLYTEAAKRIGCSLTIVRSAKKRVFNSLETGAVDFHPAAGFSTGRAEFMYWIPNGFETADIGVSLPDLPTITDTAQLAGRTLIVDPSSAESELEKVGVKLYQSPSKLEFAHAVDLLKEKRGDFYISELVEFDHYLGTVKAASPEDAGLKLHRDCCGGMGPMYLGFSRQSKHWAEVANPDYDAGKPLSETNLPIMPAKDSVAHRFGEALRQIEQEGLARRIYQRTS